MWLTRFSLLLLFSSFLSLFPYVHSTSLPPRITCPAGTELIPASERLLNEFQLNSQSSGPRRSLLQTRGGSRKRTSQVSLPPPPPVNPPALPPPPPVVDSSTSSSQCCILGPEFVVNDWDGWTGEMFQVGPQNLCQATNYIHGVFGNYDSGCPSGVHEGMQFNGGSVGCISRVDTSGIPLSIAIRCVVYGYRCARTCNNPQTEPEHPPKLAEPVPAPVTVSEPVISTDKHDPRVEPPLPSHVDPPLTRVDPPKVVIPVSPAIVDPPNPQPPAVVNPPSLPPVVVDPPRNPIDPPSPVVDPPPTRPPSAATPPSDPPVVDPPPPPPPQPRVVVDPPVVVPPPPPPVVAPPPPPPVVVDPPPRPPPVVVDPPPRPPPPEVFDPPKTPPPVVVEPPHHPNDPRTVVTDEGRIDRTRVTDTTGRVTTTIVSSPPTSTVTEPTTKPPPPPAPTTQTPSPAPTTVNGPTPSPAPSPSPNAVVQPPAPPPVSPVSPPVPRPPPPPPVVVPTPSPPSPQFNVKEFCRPVVRKGDIPMQEVSRHNRERDCYMVFQGTIIDMTSFISLNEHHPGSNTVLIPWCGRDATQEFMKQHADHIEEFMSKLMSYQHLIVGNVITDKLDTKKDNTKTSTGIPRQAPSPRSTSPETNFLAPAPITFARFPPVSRTPSTTTSTASTTKRSANWSEFAKSTSDPAPAPRPSGSPTPVSTTSRVPSPLPVVPKTVFNSAWTSNGGTTSTNTVKTGTVVTRTVQQPVQPQPPTVKPIVQPTPVVPPAPQPPPSVATKTNVDSATNLNQLIRTTNVQTTKTTRTFILGSDGRTIPVSAPTKSEAIETEALSTVDSDQVLTNSDRGDLVLHEKAVQRDIVIERPEPLRRHHRGRVPSWFQRRRSGLFTTTPSRSRQTRIEVDIRV